MVWYDMTKQTIIDAVAEGQSRQRNDQDYHDYQPYVGQDKSLENEFGKTPE